MKDSVRPPRGAPLDASALTVVMAVVPGAFSRNKHFGLYGDPALQRARGRATLLRDLVRQLDGEKGRPHDVTLVRGGGGFELRFRVASLRFVRRVLLSDVEVACLRYLLHRAGVRSPLEPCEEDRRMVEAVLHRLAPHELAPAASKSVPPSP